MMIARSVRLALVLVVLSSLGVAYGDLTWNKIDLLPSSWPDSAPNQAQYGFPCEVFSANAFFNEGTNMITVTINTNFRESGFGGSQWPDSYVYGKIWRAGDLYIAYDRDGSVWEPEAIYAVGLTDHTGNVVEQAYDDDANWGTVEKGKIYSTPTSTLTDWATGTFEGYDRDLPDAIPADADSVGVTVTENGLKPRVHDTEMEGGEYKYTNTYPTVLKSPLAELGSASVAWVLNPNSSWANRIGRYDIVIELDPSDLGLATWQLRHLSFFWTMECGNDGVLLSGPVGSNVPEPATVAFLGTVLLGVVGSSFYRKRS